MKKLVLSKTELLLFVVPVVFLAVNAYMQYRRSLPDELDKTLLEYAGANAIDCGRTTENSPSRAKVDSCAIAAYKSGKSFKVRYDNLGDDYHSSGLWRRSGPDTAIAITSSYYLPGWRSYIGAPLEVGGQEGCGTSAIASEEQKQDRRRRIFFGWLRCNDDR